MHVVTKKIIEKDLNQGPSAPKHIVTKKRDNRWEFEPRTLSCIQTFIHLFIQ